MAVVVGLLVMAVKQEPVVLEKLVQQLDVDSPVAVAELVAAEISKSKNLRIN